MSKPILILFACNDDRGNHTGHCEHVSVDLPCGETVEIEFDRMVFRDLGGFDIKLGRRVFRHSGYRNYVGNILWDAIRVDAKTAREILEYLRRRGAKCIAAPTELFEAWNNEDPLPDLEGVAT